MSLAERNMAIGMLKAGCSASEVASACSRAVSTIRRLNAKATTTGTTQDKPRSGRPQVLSRHARKLVYRAVRKNPKITYSELAEIAQVHPPDGAPSQLPSRSTLYRVIKKTGLLHVRCKKRPKLTPQRARARLLFAREYRSYPWHRRILKFSDECSIQKGSGHTTEWCFRYDDEKWKTKMVTQLSTARKPAQMVWAAVWLDERGRPRRSDLIIMQRDPDAPHGGYSAQSYIQALQQGLLPHWRDSQLFMHDNASIHTARAVASFIENYQIHTIRWPPYSPDLNPIEHLWWHLKKLVFTRYPQYNNISKAEEEWDGFCSALKTCWRAIPGSLIHALIMSMPRRIKACIEARGWQTKY
jgi:transposase